MTATNDCELVRVFTRLVGGAIADQTIKSNEPFQVVVQNEVGQGLFDTAGKYKLAVVVRDLTDGTIVQNAIQTGDFQDVNWKSLSMEFAFPTIPAQGAAKVDHIYQAIAVTTAGATNPIVGFLESDLLIITKP